MEDVVVFEVLKLREEELSIEEFTQLHNEPDIILRIHWQISITKMNCSGI